MAGSKAVYSKWVGNTLTFFTAAGLEIFSIDGPNRTLSVPAGSSVSGAGAVSGVPADGVTLASTTDMHVKDGGVGAAKLAVMAAGDLTPGAMVAYVFDVADHATQNVDEVLALGINVTDVVVIANSTNGSNANTVRLANGAGTNYITDAISTNGKSAGDVVAAASISPTYWAITAGSTLRIVQTRAGGAHAFRVIVKGFLS